MSRVPRLVPHVAAQGTTAAVHGQAFVQVPFSLYVGAVGTYFLGLQRALWDVTRLRRIDSEIWIDGMYYDCLLM